jgi:uncharacterized membrane-anchored protein
MIRVALYLIFVGAIAYGVALLADRLGDVVVVWQGLRIETPLWVLGAAILLAAIVLSFVLGFVRWIERSPIVLSRVVRQSRGVPPHEEL